MKKIRLAILYGALLAAVAAGAFWLGHDWHAPPPAGGEEAASSDEAASVQTAFIREGMITQTVQAFGSLQPKPGSSMVVSVPFDARIIQVLTTVGAKVEPGTAVVEVGPTADVQLQIRQTQDTLTAATRTLEQVRQRLQEQLATNADVTAAEAAERAARAQVESLKQKGAGSTRQVPAGIAGTVSQISIQPGQVVPSGNALITVAPTAQMEVIVGVDPSLIDTLKPGEKVSLHAIFEHGDEPKVKGKIRQIGQQINPQSRLCDISITPPANSGLLPGAFVVADLPTTSSTGLIVPKAAVTLPDGNPVVFTVLDGKAKKHVVSLGLSNADEVEVKTNDLHTGDTVITDGALEIDDGAAVKISDTAESPPATTKAGESGESPSTAPRPEAP